MSVLEEILAAKRAELALLQESEARGTLRRAALDAPPARDFAGALRRHDGRLAVVAEIKRRSPSKGELAPDLDPAVLAKAYETGGAAALSVLTEHHHFAGSLDDVREARAASSLPILRKDFVVDPYQVYETAAVGADAMLLIVAALGRHDLERLYLEARALDLDVLVEVHSERELEKALEIDADVIGINNRNLADLNVDLETTLELLAHVPAGKTVVSESGYSTREQLDELDEVGVDAVLVGETLLRAQDVEAACRALTGLHET